MKKDPIVKVKVARMFCYFKEFYEILINLMFIFTSDIFELVHVNTLKSESAKSHA